MSLITPEAYCAFLESQRMLPSGPMPSTVILSFVPPSFKSLGISPEETQRLLQGKYVRLSDRLGLLWGLGFGAASAAVYLECLIQKGAKSVITVGLVGSLTDALRAGNVAVLESAVSEEGVSAHYKAATESSSSEVISADAALTDRVRRLWDLGAEPPAVRAWTTDAFFHETAEKLARFRQVGCQVVEMEASALLSVARYRKIALTGVFIVSDRVKETGWLPASEGLGSKIADVHGRLCKALK